MSGRDRSRQAGCGGPQGSPPTNTRTPLSAPDLRDKCSQMVSRARTKDGARFPAISFRQPNADLVLEGARHRDRRSRPTRFRGWILVHAAQALRRDEVARRRSDLGLAAGEVYEPERGKLLGMVCLENCVKDGEGWAYLWKNPKRFRTAVPCRGHYSIPFYVPASLVAGTPAARVTPGKLTPKASS